MVGTLVAAFADEEKGTDLVVVLIVGTLDEMVEKDVVLGDIEMVVLNTGLGIGVVVLAEIVAVVAEVVVFVLASYFGFQKLLVDGIYCTLDLGLKLLDKESKVRQYLGLHSCGCKDWHF